MAGCRVDTRVEASGSNLREMNDMFTPPIPFSYPPPQYTKRTCTISYCCMSSYPMKQKGQLPSLTAQRLRPKIEINLKRKYDKRRGRIDICELRETSVLKNSILSEIVTFIDTR